MDNSVKSNSTQEGCENQNSFDNHVESNEKAEFVHAALLEYTNQLSNIAAILSMLAFNPDEAMQCWSKCENSPIALFNMGVAYETGCYEKYAEPDLDRAHDCYALAASMGHKYAIYNLALFYLYGKGQAKLNFDCAVELLQIASSKGVEEAQNFCSEFMKQKQEKIKELLKPYDKLRKKHNWPSCDNSPIALFNMGVAYESGCYAKKARPDFDSAHDCYELAASMGHGYASYNLALFYLYGKGKIEPNFDRAIELLQIASSKGVEAAQKYCSQLNTSGNDQ